ncbi:hypothetical protein [Glycomyces albidus]|uniref:Uncharacterized protein n=1 Tax=Glycomyces albidus TaxID=2656774 RepID=A0A6L5GDB0_9ACTN|nr:hypothetical protein [Glycomyces albidus]MQM27541.1 hypothetical protein [Glycomyces albidus]
MVEFEGSVETTFAALRERAFATGDWLWDPEDEPKKGPKPRTLAEWEESEYGNDYPGAHSIVDVREIVSGIELGQIDQGEVLALTESEALAIFGTATPSVADWNRKVELDGKSSDGAGPGLELWDVVERDSGRFLTLSDESGGRWVAFWGMTGD